MNIIMSFWSDPYKNKLHNKWLNEKTWNLSWILAVESITKSYGKPILYTDDAGKKLLVNDLGLDFEKVDLCLNDLKGTDPRFTTLGRTYSVGIQKSPFIHVDYDSYVFESIPPEVFQNGLFFQKEVFIDLNDVKYHGSSLHRPDLFVAMNGVPNWWFNHIYDNKTKIFQTGIMGGSNIEFFEKYSQIIFDMINSNKTEIWTSIEEEAKKPFIDTPAFSYGFAPQYTLDEYTLFGLSKEMNISPRFIINGYNIIVSKFSHVFSEKATVGDLHGRIMRRIIHSFPSRTKQVKNITQNNSAANRSVSTIIIPNKINSPYDTILRSIIPRKLQPNETIVSEYDLTDSDRNLISRLEGVKIIPKGDSYVESLKIAFKRTSSDIIILIDGHIKTPKLYVEKAIAANLEFPDSVFCCAATDFEDQKGKFTYGSLKDDYEVRPNIVDFPDRVLDNPEIVSLSGGMYIFTKEALHAIFDGAKKIDNFDQISDLLVESGFKVRCLKNLIASHSFKKKITI